MKSNIESKIISASAKHNYSMTHVTISTGHVRDSPRHEVANDVIDELICWIKSAKPTVIPFIDGEWPVAQVPNYQNYLAIFSCQGGCLIVTLFHKNFGPCLTFGVSPSHAEGEELWALLGSNRSQPKGAWCGVKFEPGLFSGGFSILKDIGWFGDFERSVAWAWLSLWESENKADPNPAQEDVASEPAINTRS